MPDAGSADWFVRFERARQMADTIHGMSAETVFEDLLAELAEAGAVAERMFGARSITVRKKVLAILQDDRIVLRLGAGTPEHEEALALPGAELWQAPGRPRPYKDWVSVLVEENSELEDTEIADLARAALQHLDRSPT
jgi:TfoX/Sxy family transcriptional regulator of competence genes